ncbi:MAG TPA: hypothetical protein VGM88_20755 [Kofleriaceae bacterium]|jgi:hypothetical protein
MHRAALLALALTAGACHGGAGPKTPAADGVREYLAALKSDDPRAAYGLLADEVRRHTSYDDFALAWKDSKTERAWQAKVLEEAVHGSPDVGERALATFSDGKLVALTREGAAWHLESELVTRSRALRPRDAVRMFADAIAARDVSAILGALTERRRAGLQRQVEGFVAGIGKHVNGPLEELADRAELRWDENGIRYRIVLRKDKDDWRVDDIYIRPIPKGDEDPSKSMHEDSEDDMP